MLLVPIATGETQQVDARVPQSIGNFGSIVHEAGIVAIYRTAAHFWKDVRAKKVRADGNALPQIYQGGLLTADGERQLIVGTGGNAPHAHNREDDGDE